MSVYNHGDEGTQIEGSHKGVDTKAVHGPPVLWDALISQQVGEEVHALWVSCEPIQNPPSLLDIVPGVGAEGMDHVWEDVAIPDKKDLQGISSTGWLAG